MRSVDAQLKHPHCSLVMFQFHFSIWPPEADKQPYKKHTGVWGGEGLEYKLNCSLKPQIFIGPATKHLAAQKLLFPQDDHLP